MVPFEWVGIRPPWIENSSEADSAHASEGRDASARVLFTRSVRRRNFTGFPFWVSCPPETCALVAARARDFAETLPRSKTIALSDYPPEAIGFFRERQWLPERPISFPGKRDYKTLFLGADPAEHALLGEVEHWTHIKVRPGLPDEVDVPSLPALMESMGPFSHSPGYGFLTSNPIFAGAGLQVECAVHLPALTENRRAQSVQQALNAVGLELQPLMLRTPGAAEAGFFRVLSRGGMKFPEDQLYRRFVEQISFLLKTEVEVLEKWHDKEKNRLEDRIYRSLRLLQEARTLDFPELLMFASFTRIGVYLGYFPASLLPHLEDLRIRTQPSHLSILQNQALSPQIDIFRADLVRASLEAVVPRF